MSKFIYLMFALLLTLLHVRALNLNAYRKNHQNIDVQLRTNDDINPYMDEIFGPNSNIIIMEETETTKQQTRDDKQPTVIYWLGERQPGDSLVATHSDSHTYPTPHNVQIALRYPSSGNGAEITYIEVPVYQDLTDGRAFILSGDIGQRHIEFVLEADETTFFNYTISIYGKP